MKSDVKKTLVALLKKFCAFLIFLALGVAISLIFGVAFGTIFYLMRDVALIDAICKDMNYSFPFYVYDFTFGLSFFGFVISAISLRKFLFRGLGFVFTPLVLAFFVLSFLLSLFSLTGCETQCIYNPLIDTQHSADFNPYNVPKLSVGMSKEEVISLIGTPLGERSDYMTYTSDGAFKFGDFAWFELLVKLEDSKVSEITSLWCDD